MKKVFSVLCVMSLLVLVSCGGTTGTNATDNNQNNTNNPTNPSGNVATGLNGATSVSGVVKSPSGDPVAGATVYISGADASKATFKATRTKLVKLTGTDGATCDDPAVVFCAAGCTDASGAFNLDVSACTNGETQFIMEKGTWKKVSDLSCSAGACTLAETFTTFGGGTGSTTWPKIAVVTGAYDRMEDVLAKLADTSTSDDVNGQYGRVDSYSGEFVYGSEYGTNMTIVDGTGGLYPDENDDVLTYSTWDKYLNGTLPLVLSGEPVFDIIFINCGNGYEGDLPSNEAVLKNYVEAGGRLYVTDWSYDFVEQVFPYIMKFEGDPNDPNVSGAYGDARNGTDGVFLNANVSDSGMKNWLKTVDVNAHDATLPGNPGNNDDCSADPHTQHTGALTAEDLVPIGDFWVAWVRMVSRHAGDTNTQIWVSSGTQLFEGQLDRPLTITRDVGTLGGRVIYSSYHTAESCPSTTFWPQERVLQYLIFESF